MTVKRKFPIKSIFTVIVLTLMLLFALFPFFWLMRTAVTPAREAFSTKPQLLPQNLTLENLERVISSPTIPFTRQFGNSLIVAVSTTIFVIVVGASGAYALARLKFKGQQTFSLSLLFIQLFPAVLLVIPLFIVMVNLKLTNSLFGLILAYSTSNLPFVVWLLRGYFLSLPAELEDAARIDGCTTYGVLFRIILPLAAPGIAAAATLAFVNGWNEFLVANVLINDSRLRVLSIGLTSYIDQFGTDYSGLFSMAMLTTLPVVLVFMLFQRYIVGGLTAGAVKS